MTDVTVYSLPENECSQCRMTAMILDRNNVTYTKVMLNEDPAALAKVKELGYLAAPVVVVGDDHWSGFRPDKLNALAAA